MDNNYSTVSSGADRKQDNVVYFEFFYSMSDQKGKKSNGHERSM